MHWTPGSSGNVCDSGDTETFYTIWRSGVNPGSISGGLAIQFQCNQILLRTHRSTRHHRLTSLLSPSQGGKGWISRRRFRKFIVYILFVAMRSPGKNDSPRRPVDSQVSWLSYTSIYPSPFLQPLSPTLPQPECWEPLQVETHQHCVFSRLSAFRPRALSSLWFSYLCQSRGLVTFFAHLTSAQFKAGACSLSVFPYLSRLSCANKGLSSFIYVAPSQLHLTHSETGLAASTF